MSGGAVRPFSNPFLDRNSYYEEIYNNSWTLANQNVNATYPRMSIGTNNNNYRNSTYWQRDSWIYPLKISRKLVIACLKKYTRNLVWDRYEFICQEQTC